MLTVLPWSIVGVTLIAVLLDFIKMVKLKQTEFLSNDLRNDYQRWEPSHIAIAGYVAIFLDNSIRLNPYFQSIIYAVLKRSPRAIDEKMRRISTVGANKSDASRADEDIAFLLAQTLVGQAQEQFISDLYTAGASKKQVAEIKKYL
jgi:hypothetical protein